ncbi:uncharacterized protein [Cicer arietinum]|uniref:uncharacterized protein isoform X3 n=1 Tax=Cicer arietinum TaxID=3827 RepID=UPI003CC52D5B
MNSGSNTLFRDIQSSNISFWPTFTGGERAQNSFSSIGQFPVPSPASGLNFCSSNMQPTSKMAFEWFSAKYATSSMSGCPRVFCMGISGHLLLSNTGLLGIVCSCHRCHMSILKFCEHSGLHGINPGDAVRMESGETIAEWQKLYFSKFGIRSSGNENEWDWPEVLSTTSSLMESNAFASDMSKSDLSHILNSAAATLRKQPITNQDGFIIPLKGLNAFTQNSQYDQGKTKLMESNVAICTHSSNFFGAQLDDGCQSIPPFLDTLKRNGYLSIIQSTQIPTSHRKDLECIKKENVKSSLLGKDATSSNIELRLGQPPQAGNPVSSFAESPMFTFASSPKLHSLKQMTNNLSRKVELQKNFSHIAGTIEMREEPTLLKPPNYMSGFSNISGAVTASSQTDYVAKSSLFLPFPQFSSQPMVKTKACKNLGYDGIMPKNLFSEYGTVQFGSSNVLWNSNGHTRRQSNDSASELNEYLDKDKVARFGEDCCTKINSQFEVNQSIEFGSIRRTVVDSGSCTPVVSGKIYESRFESDTSVGANALQGSNNVSLFGRNNHLILGTSTPFEGNLKSLPYLVSSSTQNQSPTLLQRGINMDTYMSDENMKLLALTQTLELSKQQQTLYFPDMNLKQGKSIIAKPQNDIYKASVSEQGSSGAPLKFPQNRGTCWNLENTDGLNRHCDLSALAPIPLQSIEKKSQCKYSYDHQNDGPTLSLGMNNTRSSEKCSKQPSNIHFVGKYASAAWENCCRNNACTRIRTSRGIVKGKPADANVVTSWKIASECSRDQNASMNGNLYFELSATSDGHGTVKSGSHTPQWRDVPSKVRKPLCDATLSDQIATVLDWERQESLQVENISAKCLKKVIDREDLLKKQENFNDSSGCNAPVVSQASVTEVNKVDCCPVDATDAGCIENLVLDEGSGIDKGMSSFLADSEKSAEYAGSTSGSDLKKGYLRVLNDQSCQSLIDDIKLLDSLIWKKRQDQNQTIVSANCAAIQSLKVKKGFKGKKQKRNEARVLDASLDNQKGESTGAFDSPSSLCEEMQLYFSSSQQRSSDKASIVQPNTNHNLRPSSFSSKFLSCKNHLNKHRCNEDSYESESNSDAEFHLVHGVSRMKKLRRDFTSDCFGHFQTQEPSYEEPKSAMQMSSSSIKGNAHRIKRPVVCGKYGEISSELSITEVPEPAKLVFLSKVLKTSERCMVPTIETPKLTTKKKWRRLDFGTCLDYSCFKSGLKAKKDNESKDTVMHDETNSDVSMEGFERVSKKNVIYKGKRDTKERHGDIVSRADAPWKVKSRKIRKERSINEITAEETQMENTLKYAEGPEHGLYTRSKIPVQEHANISIINADSFCCVCQLSSNDEGNNILECSRCPIKVHQACYGISALPKRGRWYCRPCRTKSIDMACVLCGYGDGAMTGALSSRLIVKSLLKVWSFEKDRMAIRGTSQQVYGKKVAAFHSSKTGCGVDQELILRPENIGTSSTDLANAEISTNNVVHTPCTATNLKVHNSITAGVLDSTVKQWVHMVCGLWTPGTRCPSRRTMSAFDVSGVSRPKADEVCSICNRWGGSCIKCRVVGCSVKFHPWCAHQKNLLQNETEGVNDEKVGFYGRCVLHGIGPNCQSTYDPTDEMDNREEKEFTCARAEGYKGHGWDGIQNNHRGGFLVPDKKIEAWDRISKQKLRSQGIPKFLDSDIMKDCQHGLKLKT